MRRKIGKLWALLLLWWRRNEYCEVVPLEAIDDEPIDTGEPSDSRRKQRKRIKMAEGFLRAIREIADDIRHDTRSNRGDLRFARAFGEVSVNMSPGMLALIKKYADISFEAPYDSAKSVATIDDLDVTIAIEATDEAGGWVLTRYRRAGLRFCRSRLPLYIPGAKWVSQVITGRRMAGWAGCWLYFTLDEGDSWYTLTVGADHKTRIQPCIDTDEKEPEEFWRELRFLRGATFARHVNRLAWKIVMERGALRFAFHCNDAIAREMLALRDSSRGRRAAALHWVTDHDRKIGEGRKTHVRAHLRGAQEFAWEEWRCALSPGLFDQEALATERIPEMEISQRSRLIAGIFNR